jgi:alanine racemase
MSRPARAVVDLQALTGNYDKLRQCHGGKTLAVLKANAYGHGAVQCARALEHHGLDGFAVAFVEEALQLREAGIRGSILVLEGVFEASEVSLVAEADLWTVVHHEDQLRMLEQHTGSAQLTTWLKVDCGMARAGFPLNQVRAAYQRLLLARSVGRTCLMTHFARADEPDEPTTRRQIDAFDTATRGMVGERSLGNSAGILEWSTARRDWGRAGIALYGVEPIPGYEHKLMPVMTLESAVFATRTLKPGDALGYGHTFVAQRDMRVGLVAIGYADGYPRGASNGAPVSIDGQLSVVLGRVSMDMTTVDLTELPDAGIGSRVELWGREVSVEDVARHSSTIPYELLCNVKRVAFTYEQRPAFRELDARLCDPR